MFTVIATSCGNPDYYQDPSEPVCCPLVSKCPSITGCVDEFRSWIDKNDLGGGNLDKATLFDDTGALGRISYNGRCWDKNDNEIEVDKNE